MLRAPPCPQRSPMSPPPVHGSTLSDPEAPSVSKKEPMTQAMLVVGLTCTGRYKPSVPPTSTLSKPGSQLLSSEEDGADGSSIDLAFRSFVMAVHAMQALEVQPSNVPLALEPFVQVDSEGEGGTASYPPPRALT